MATPRIHAPDPPTAAAALVLSDGGALVEDPPCTAVTVEVCCPLLPLMMTTLVTVVGLIEEGFGVVVTTMIDGVIVGVLETEMVLPVAVDMETMLEEVSRSVLVLVTVTVGV